MTISVSQSSKQFIKNVLKSFKLYLDKNQMLLPFDNNRTNKHFFKNAFNDFKNVKIIQTTFSHLFEHNPTNAEFLGFLENYETSFLKEEYGNKAVELFEERFLHFLREVDIEDFKLDDNNTTGKWILGDYVKPYYSWGSDVIIELVDENNNPTFFSDAVDRDYGSRTVVELVQGELNGNTVFYQKYDW